MQCNESHSIELDSTNTLPLGYLWLDALRFAPIRSRKSKLQGDPLTPSTFIAPYETWQNVPLRGLWGLSLPFLAAK